MHEIPGYDVLEVIGRGGSGEVLRARDRRLGREVAIKRLLSGANEKARRRFAREGRVLARLDHPGIVTVYEAGEDAGGAPYIVMDLVPGASLQDLIDREGKLRPDQALGIVEQIASALDAAHRAGLLHRDVKPDNILVTPGSALLTDFGLVSYIDDDGRRCSGSTFRSGLTDAGLFVGTVGFSAPEQAAGDLEDVGPPADIYGLGASLYFALTGRPPFEGRTPVEILKAQMQRHGLAGKPAPPVRPALRGSGANSKPVQSGDHVRRVPPRWR